MIISARPEDGKVTVATIVRHVRGIVRACDDSARLAPQLKACVRTWLETPDDVEDLAFSLLQVLKTQEGVRKEA